jgi:hypothetical protein
MVSTRLDAGDLFDWWQVNALKKARPTPLESNVIIAAFPVPEGSLGFGAVLLGRPRPKEMPLNPNGCSVALTPDDFCRPPTMAKVRRWNADGPLPELGPAG